MIELTEQLRKALDAAPDRPVELVDPRTKRVYLLLPADGFDGQEQEDDAALSMNTVSLLVDEAMKEEDVDDPYLQYDPRQQQPP
jgi:hypothetical protein